MSFKSVSADVRPNPIGTISLAIAALGFAAIEWAHWAWGGDGLLWSLSRAAFEAALIGGVADWFAVTALFRPVPNSRFALPHTDLIIQNRDELTAGMVGMVNHMLSPASVKEGLNKFSVSDLLISQLDSPTGRAHAVEALRSLASRFSGELEDEKLRQFLTDLLREQIRNADLASLLGRWLKARVAAGDMRVIWTSLAGTLADKADAGEFDEFISEALSASFENYKAENCVTGFFVGFVFKPNEATISVRSALTSQLREQARLKNHPFNRKLDAVVRDYAQQLMDKDAAALRSLHKLQARLADHADLEQVVGHLLGDLRRLMEYRLKSEPEEVGRMLENVIERSVSKLKADTDAQQKLDAWARSALQDLVERYHSVIGDTARDAIDRLKPDELVQLLESRVGHDLQYIRLNGAVVGALVGIAIASGRWLLR